MTTASRRRGEEAVAEAREAVSRAEVEPDEEDAGEEEVADEVEDVQRADEVGDREERPLQRLLPREAEQLLDREDPVGVRERRAQFGSMASRAAS